MRDTVAAIARDNAFQRATSRSLWERLVDLIVRTVRDLIAALPDFRIGNWLVITIAVLLTVLIVARVVVQKRAEREIWAGDRGGRRLGRRTDPWTEAERLASSGSYVEAAHALCAALLVSCARRGELQLHPSKTTGDYARELRRRGAASEHGFQKFRSRYDRVVYDAQQCSADEYAALLADARPLLVERAA